MSFSTRCDFDAYQWLLSFHSKHIFSPLVLFLAPDVTAQSHVRHCIIYQYIQSDVLASSHKLKAFLSSAA